MALQKEKHLNVIKKLNQIIFCRKRTRNIRIKAKGISTKIVSGENAELIIFDVERKASRRRIEFEEKKLKKTLKYLLSFEGSESSKISD